MPKSSKKDFEALCKMSEDSLIAFSGYHFEEVPYSKILIGPGWLHDDGEVPPPKSQSEPPRLIKHTNGFYSVVDGRRRLYYDFRQRGSLYNFKTNQDRIYCASDVYVFCLVKNEISSNAVSGMFVWQFGDPRREIKTSFLKRIWRGISGYSRFWLIRGKIRKNLSISTQMILGEVEDLIGTLYSDGNSRLRDLKVIAKLEEYSKPGKTKELLKSQFKRLKKYKKYLLRLAIKDDNEGKKAEALLVRLSKSLENELQRNKIKKKYQKEIVQLKIDIHKLIDSYEGQIALLDNDLILQNRDVFEKSINKLIEDEQAVLDNINEFTLRDKTNWG